MYIIDSDPTGGVAFLLCGRLIIFRCSCSLYCLALKPNNMKLIRLVLPVAALLATCIYLSCQKTDTPSGPEPGAGHQVELVTAHVSGRVIDDQRLPVNGATIRIGTTTLTTDVNGLFTVSNIQVDKTATLVRVEKDGFFKGMKTLVVTPNKDNTVTIELLPKTVTGTFTASGGGTVSLPSGGGSIVFEANSIMNPANNAGYTGAVSVSAFFINPAADNFQDIMPGTLRGIDANNNETGLKSYGMMAVELAGSGGQKLQLAGGKKAVIRFPIPASLQGEAPATIPLWSLNDTTGLWKEEGVATRQGNEYVGSVGHFSYWNCDAPFPVITFTATIKTQQNAGLAGARVVISATGNDSTLSGFGYTNPDGLATGMIPANRPLTLKVYNKCGNLLHTKNIGPFTASTDLGTITVDATTYEVNFTGTVVNCNAAAVTNGYVTVSLEGQHYRGSLVNGSFGFSIARCSNTAMDASIVAYDIAGNQSSTPILLPVNGSTVNAGQLVACGTSLTQYINYTINGISSGFSGADSLGAYRALQSNQTVLSGSDGVNHDFALGFKGEAAPGISALYLLHIRENGTIYTRSSDITVNITEYVNAPGGFIAGNFAGTVKDTLTSNILPITCTFRVKKLN